MDLKPPLMAMQILAKKMEQVGGHGQSGMFVAA
jgi:hypothetical protein